MQHIKPTGLMTPTEIDLQQSSPKPQVVMATDTSLDIGQTFEAMGGDIQLEIETDTLMTESTSVTSTMIEDPQDGPEAENMENPVQEQGVHIQSTVQLAEELALELDKAEALARAAYEDHATTTIRAQRAPDAATVAVNLAEVTKAAADSFLTSVSHDAATYVCCSESKGCNYNHCYKQQLLELIPLSSPPGHVTCHVNMTHATWQMHLP